ncbi:MerR family DNA-binding transcriptional regulator [Crocosphaera chwakensis]|nr:MerR family DNA-binding transcriptional regulator [Crocosphaera chwakensis]
MSEFVSPKEAAQHFGVSVDTLRRWEKAGKISAIIALRILVRTVL